METMEINPFLLERLYRNTEIPTHVYQDGVCIVQIPRQKPEEDLFECDKELLGAIIQTIDANEKPILYMEMYYFFFGGFMDSQGHYFIWGPISRKELNGQKQASYYHRHHVGGKRVPIVKHSLQLLSNILSIAYYGYCGKCVPEEDIFTDTQLIKKGYAGKEKQGKDPGDFMKSAEMEHYQIDKSELNRTHDSVEYEGRLTAAVETGDVAAIKQLMLNAFNIDRIGTVAKNELKQTEYLCVTFSCIISRAAVRGGMNPETAYDLSDIYLQKLEKCKSVEEMGLLFLKMPLDYAERVRQAREQRKGNVYVEKTKDFIARNLRREFRIQEMSESFGISRSYLSKIFAQQEGITIQQYIIRERLEHAANMLRYTDYAISVIADYFCFSTQSHFGKQFKEHFGMTPREYRQQNRLIESFGRE